MPREVLREAREKQWLKHYGKCDIQLSVIPRRWGPDLMFTLHLLIASEESLEALGVTVLIKSKSSAWSRQAETFSAVILGEKRDVG